MVTRSGNMTTVTSQVPDYAAQARALQKAANIQAQSQAQANAIRDSMLSATTVEAGGATRGSIYFDATKIQKAVLHIPVGNGVFEFQFPPGN
jgi:hypothetical protein